MRRKLLPLCAALALLFVAVGGVTAADAADTTAFAPDDADDDGGDVGICVVGADSPCNGPEAENGTTESTHPTPHEDSTESNDDSTAIDDGTDSADSDDDEAGICLVGADSPCNGDSDDATGGEQIGSEDGDDGQMWIPEDQDRDGDIDDRFRGDGPFEVLGAVLSLLGSR